MFVYRYAFLIGGDGFIYEGRGWGKYGAHTYGYNCNSVGVGFIGKIAILKFSPNTGHLIYIGSRCNLACFYIHGMQGVYSSHFAIEMLVCQSCWQDIVLSVEKSLKCDHYAWGP